MTDKEQYDRFMEEEDFLKRTYVGYFEEDCKHNVVMAMIEEDRICPRLIKSLNLFNEDYLPNGFYELDKNKLIIMLTLFCKVVECGAISRVNTPEGIYKELGIETKEDKEWFKEYVEENNIINIFSYQHSGEKVWTHRYMINPFMYVKYKEYRNNGAYELVGYFKKTKKKKKGKLIP